MSMSIDWFVRNHLRRIIHGLLLFSCRKRKENTILWNWKTKFYSIAAQCAVCLWSCQIHSYIQAFRIWSEILLLFTQNMCNKRRSTLHAIACHSLQKSTWVSRQAGRRYITLVPFSITLFVRVYVHIVTWLCYIYLLTFRFAVLRAPRCARCLRSHRWCRPRRTRTPCGTLRRLPS